jgi:hypothetical protein
VFSCGAGPGTGEAVMALRRAVGAAPRSEAPLAAITSEVAA